MRVNKSKLFMVVGAIAIILFIIWFYFGELSLPERVLQESTITEQVENTRKSSFMEVRGHIFDVKLLGLYWVP
jgi:hypothetical protein